MTLGALVAAGASLAEVSRTLEALGVPFETRTETAEVGGVRALRITVEHSDQHVHRTFADIRRLVEEAALPERAARRALAAFGLLAAAEGASPEERVEHALNRAERGMRGAHVLPEAKLAAGHHHSPQLAKRS